MAMESHSRRYTKHFFMPKITHGAKKCHFCSIMEANMRSTHVFYGWEGNLPLYTVDSLTFQSAGKCWSKFSLS